MGKNSKNERKHFRTRTQNEINSNSSKQREKNIKYRGPKKLKSKGKKGGNRRQKKRSVSQHHISMKRDVKFALSKPNEVVYAASNASNDSESLSYSLSAVD